MNVSFVTRGAAFAVLLFAPLALPAQEAAPAAGPGPSVELMPLVTKRSLLLDITDTASRGVMVGERGHVLVSESRSDWRQIDKVPTRVTLTGVAAAGTKVWAVGHEGTILHSADGGETWTQQRHDPPQPPDDSAEFDMHAGAPLLDVLFIDEQRGLAVGAYSLMLRTEDGGATWTKVDLAAPEAPADAEPAADDAAEEGAGDDEWTFSEDDLMLDEEDDPHLNGIARDPSGKIIVVGERGSVFRTADGGTSWERLQLPYGGSMFGVVALGNDHFAAYGLRGHVLETRDGGTTWNDLPTDTELSLMGGAALENGGLVVVGANGVVLHRPTADAPLKPTSYTTEAGETPVLAGVLPLGSRTFLVCGDKGVGRYEIPL